jgi:Uma2 family endonuclease
MVGYTLKRWTVDEYRRLTEAGLLHPEDRVELLDGQIVEKMTHNPPHFVCLQLIQEALRDRLGREHHVRAQGPITLGDSSQPEPDLAVVRGRIVDFLGRHPGPGEIELLVEVSDSSLERDRRFKADLYGREGIRELWIVDLKERRLEIYREPGARGYDHVEILREGRRFTPLFDPHALFEVAELLPPPSA